MARLEQAAERPSEERSEDDLQRLQRFLLQSDEALGLIPSGPSGTLFRNLDKAIREDACQNLLLRDYSPGSVIFQEDMTCEEVYVVLSGHVQLQLFRDAKDTHLLRPKPPVNEVIALETALPHARQAADFTLQEHVLQALKERGSASLPRARTVTCLTPIETPQSTPRSATKVLPKAAGASRSPEYALQRDDRILRPLGEVIQALAAIEFGEEPAISISFQQQWLQFQEQVDSLGAAPPRSAGVEEAPEGIEATPADVGEEVTAAPVLLEEEQAGCGSILGVACCIAGTAHSWRAVAGENCRMLVFDIQLLGRALKDELKRRKDERRALLNALAGPLRALDKEKLENLVTASKAILFRRGEKLCVERETRHSKSLLQVLMAGEVRCLREAQGSHGRLPKAHRWMSLTSAGTLLPGQAVNAASVLADEPEPYTVVVDSSEALVLSLAYTDLVRGTSSLVLEQLKALSLRMLLSRQQAASTWTQPASKELPRRQQPTKELVSLQAVLHDRPAIVCQTPRQPPGLNQQVGRDLMTSSLSVHRASPNVECPKVHPDLLPALKDTRQRFLRSKEPLCMKEDLSASLASSLDWTKRQWPRDLRRARSTRGLGSEEMASTFSGAEDALSSSIGVQSLLERGVKHLKAKKGNPPAKAEPRRPQPPLEGPEGNLRVASIEQFLRKGDSWRSMRQRFGRTLQTEECNVLPRL